MVLLLTAGAARGGDPWRPRIPLGLDGLLPVPAGNPLTAEGVSLGRELFFDPRLSRDRSLSCASCHRPEWRFTDDRPLAVGVFGRTGGRRTPSLLNRAYGRAFFWDGRETTLEEQVVQPIVNPKEMDLPLEEAVARLRPRVQTVEELSYALASYIRTVLAGDSPYDRYLAGDASTLNARERQGLTVFRGKGNCVACHLGPNLTDEQFHNTGIGWRDGGFIDLGRFAVTNDQRDRGAFKTPTLRNVARFGPYMHDGSLATLADVVEHYDKGGLANPYLDPDIEPLHLSAEEKDALIAFLGSLTGPVREGI